MAAGNRYAALELTRRTHTIARSVGALLSAQQRIAWCGGCGVTYAALRKVGWLRRRDVCVWGLVWPVELLFWGQGPKCSEERQRRQRMTCDTSFGVRICVSFSAFPLYPHGHTVATVAKQRFMFYLL